MQAAGAHGFYIQFVLDKTSGEDASPSRNLPRDLKIFLFYIKFVLDNCGLSETCKS